MEKFVDKHKNHHNNEEIFREESLKFVRILPLGVILES